MTNWNKVTVGQVRASGFSNISSWQQAVASGQALAPGQTSPTPAPAPQPITYMVGPGGVRKPVMPATTGGFTGVGQGTLSAPTATNALQVFDVTTGESQGFVGAGGIRYPTEQQAIDSTRVRQPTTSTTQRELQISEQYAKSGLDPTKILDDPSTPGYLQANIPASGFRYDPNLNKSILDKTARGESLTVQEKEYVLQYAGGRTQVVEDPTKRASVEEELAREAEQARLEQATKDMGVSDALRDEKRLSAGEMQDRQDKLAQAKNLLASMSLKGRVGDINRVIASSVVGIKEKTLASKSKVGSEIEELIRQQSNLITAVTVPDGKFFYPELMSVDEKRFAIGTEKFFVDRDKALFQQQDEFSRFLIDQQLAGVLEQGVMVGSIAREIGFQEQMGLELADISRQFGLVSKNGFYDVKESIPSSLTGVKREEVSSALESLAKKFEDSDSKILDLSTSLRKKDFELIVPSEEDLSKIKPVGFFSGLTKNIEGFRESVAPLNGDKKSLGFEMGIKVSPLFEDKILGIKEKTLFKDFGKDTSVARFVSSFPLGITRFGELGEKLAGENVSLLKARFAGASLTEKDLEVISPSITGIRKLVESSSIDYSKIKSVEDFGSAWTGKVEKDLGVLSTIGLSLASKIKKDPFGEIGEIVGPTIILGGTKLGLQSLKTKLAGPPLPASELSSIVKSVNPDYFRSTKTFLSQTDDISRIGYSRLEASTRKFLGLADKTDDALKLSVAKSNAQVQKNISNLLSDKTKLVSQTVERKQFLDSLKKEVLGEKPPVGKTPSEVFSPNVKLVDPGTKVSLKQLFLDRKQEAKRILDVQQANLKQMLLDKQALLKKAVDKRTIEGKLNQDLLRQETAMARWGQQASIKKAVEKNLMDRDLELLLKRETPIIENITKELKLEDSIKLLLKRQEFETTYGLAKQQALKTGQKLGKDSVAFQRYEALTAERINLDNLIKEFAKEISKRPDGSLPGVSITKAKPFVPPASDFVQVPTKDGTILLAKLGRDPTKGINDLLKATKSVFREDTSVINIVKPVVKESERLFPKFDVVKIVPQTKTVSGVQPVYGFTIPGIQKVSSSMFMRLKDFKEEESELIQVARNIGVSDIPSASNFLKSQEPAIIKTREYTPSMVDSKVKENLNEQLVESGLRNLRDTSRGISLSKTLEEQKLSLDIGLKEKSVIKEIQGIKLGLDRKSLEGVRQVDDVSLKQDIRVKQFFKTFVDTKIVSGTMQKQLTKQLVDSRLKQQYYKSDFKVKEDVPIVPVIPGLAFDSMGDDDKKLQRLFKFYEIRGEPRGGRTTKKYLGMFPLIKGLNIGAERVGQTPSRTIKYVPTNVKAMVKDDTKFKYAEQFRRPGRTTKLTGSPGARFLIEKSRYAIESPEEKKGITMKGIMARQSTARLNKSFLGLTSKNNRRVKNGKKKSKSIKRR